MAPPQEAMDVMELPKSKLAMEKNAKMVSRCCMRFCAELDHMEFVEKHLSESLFRLRRMKNPNEMARAACEEAEAKIMGLLDMVTTHRRQLFDREYYEERVEHVVRVQRQVRRNLQWKKFQKFIKSSANSVGRRRYRIQQEFISTERTYVSQLLILCNKFLAPLSSGKVEGVDDKDVKRIFSNARTLLQCAEMFYKDIAPGVSFKVKSKGRKKKLKDLKQIQGPRVDFGGIFIKLGPFFKLYSEYIVNFDASRNLLQKLREENQAFSDFLVSTERAVDPRGKTPLEGYLILPVQRIPRYKMLLSELLKFTQEGHVDRENIKKALAYIEGVANSINESKRKAESSEKAAEITKILDCGEVNLLESHRTYFYEGPGFGLWESEAELAAHSRRMSVLPTRQRQPKIKPSPFYFFLFNDLLIYATDNSGVFGDKKYRMVNFFVIAEKMMLVEDPDCQEAPADLFCFEIRYPRRNFLIGVKTEKEKKEWVFQIKKAKTSAALNKGRINIVKSGNSDALALCRERGWLLKRSDILKTWKERYFKLKGNTLFFYVAPDEALRNKIVNLQDYSIEYASKEVNHTFAFKLTHKPGENKTVYLSATDGVEFRRWIFTFINSNYDLGEQLLFQVKRYDERKPRQFKDSMVEFQHEVDESLRVQEAESELLHLLDDMTFTEEPETGATSIAESSAKPVEVLVVEKKRSATSARRTREEGKRKVGGGGGSVTSR
eukprot:CAMPEP_0119137266 /NCGR_PEP_ID=MMETSP1310-20130426/23265_1 /TAXON_ID=464262 /ORGANISM="Genus nov. species nov., Strain RCC2339" /LENGTH=720 /DNA_ID=CAMNT_0007128335 /DNA_START=89 /DNA_END=2248 /DNA_ORIENTATION=-